MVVVTSYYCPEDSTVALKDCTKLRFVHQDHLSGTAVITDTNGEEVGSIKYYPFGETRTSSGTLETDKKFTGQRLDDTGLYYYGARYYDPAIGRFISADTLVPGPANPQAFNRYSYCLNNPLRYNDPSGHQAAALAEQARNFEQWGSMLDPRIGAPLKAVAKVLIATAAILEAAELLERNTGININDPGTFVDCCAGFISEAFSSTPGERWERVYAGEGLTNPYPDLPAMPDLVNIESIPLDPVVVQNFQEGFTLTRTPYNTGLETFPGVNVDPLNVNYSSRNKDEKIRDIQENPENWEKVGDSAEPATSPSYKGGTSVRETWRHKATGEEVERHVIYGPSGKVVHGPHWGPAK